MTFLVKDLKYRNRFVTFDVKDIQFVDHTATVPDGLVDYFVKSPEFLIIGHQIDNHPPLKEIITPEEARYQPQPVSNFIVKKLENLNLIYL